MFSVYEVWGFPKGTCVKLCDVGSHLNTNIHCILPGSSVVIATDYELDGPGIESWWGEIFPPVHTGPGAYQASWTIGIGSFPEVKYGRGVLLTTHPLLVPWSWKSRSIPLPTLCATTGPVTGTLYFTCVQKVTFRLALVAKKLIIRRAPAICDTP